MMRPAGLESICVCVWERIRGWGEGAGIGMCEKEKKREGKVCRYFGGCN